MSDPMMEPMMDRSDCLRALIRRGRGDGRHRALKAEPKEVWGIVEECLWEDPRIDRQCERRGRYLASIALETKMPGKVIARVVSERQSEDDSWLPVEVAGQLAAAGDADCRSSLLDCIQKADRWDVALSHIETDAEVIEAILSRAENADEEMLDDLVVSGPNEMVPQLAECRNPKLAAIARWRLDQQVEIKRKYALALKALEKRTLAELLATKKFEVSVTDVFGLPAFKSTPSTSDVEAVRCALNLKNTTGLRLALWWLKRWPQPTLLDSILALYEKYLQTPSSPPWISSQVGEALSALPGEEGLRLARDWFDGPDEARSWLGSWMLERRATVADVGRVQSALKKLPDNLTSLYPICDMLNVLARMPDIGWLPEVEDAYLSLRYSYGRSVAAKALAAMDRKRFDQIYAQECLKDCESRTRVLAGSEEEEVSWI